MTHLHHQSSFDRFYPHKRGWPDLPHSASNLSHSHSPSHSILLKIIKVVFVKNKQCILHNYIHARSVSNINIKAISLEVLTQKKSGKYCTVY